MASFIEELENLIREGRFDEVEVRLGRLGKVERKDAVPTANIARRVNRLTLAAKILHPFVRPSDPHLQAPATPFEKIEYADALRQLGAVDEAWALLNEVNAQTFPQVSIHKAFCLFSQWKYAEALPILRQYVEAESLSPYTRTVGQINFAAALIQEAQLTEATELLSRLREETRTSGAMLLYGNSLELSAQVMIYQKDFDRALHLLAEASDVLKSAGKVVSLNVQKWSAIAESLKQNTATAQLEAVFLKAQQAKHWETVRDCDLYLAHLRQDQAGLRRVYIGTPFESFRQRIFHVAGPRFEPPETYVWSGEAHPAFVFDVSSGRLAAPKKSSLPTGQALHRFMILLTQDFYRPVTVLNAFGKLFPKEFMNANTSANRIHQIVKRYRKWIDDSSLPLRLDEADGAYRLLLQRNVGLILPGKPLPLNKQEIAWALLKSQVGDNAFDIHQANQILCSSASNTKVLLRWASSAGRLLKSGKASGTSYRAL